LEQNRNNTHQGDCIKLPEKNLKQVEDEPRAAYKQKKKNEKAWRWDLIEAK
jgi:uncharacterized cysteine cluster protein YcgN (CxxCxxCC family)